METELIIKLIDQIESLRIMIMILFAAKMGQWLGQVIGLLKRNHWCEF